MHPHRSFPGIAALLGAFLLPAAASAAPPAAEPTGTVGSQAPASAGTTEVDGSGKFAAAATDEAAAADDANELELSAGGLLSTGNARAGSVTGGARFRVKRKKHQGSGAFAGNYGRAAPANSDAPTDVTVSNVQGRLRYDYFLHDRVSAFLMGTARHDRFQGLQARINVDPGFAFYILKDPKNRLWAEVGYDFQYDRFVLEATYEKDADGKVVVDTNGDPVVAIARDRYNHAVRLFGGYANHINDAVTFSTGVEYLQSVLFARRWRVNWDTSITATLVNRLALAFTFTARIDNDPAPGIRKVDTITSASLVYRFF